MKKLLSLISGSLLATIVLIAPASAATCEITNTGPGSSNTCTVNEDYVVEVTCVNGFTVSSESVQTALSGQATVSGNTIASNANTGNAENKNELANEFVAFCATAATTPAPENPVTPAVVSAAPVTNPAEIKALPKTGETPVLKTVGAIALGLGALIAAGYTVSHQLAIRRSSN